MFCNFCGSKIPEGTKVCPNCDAKIPAIKVEEPKVEEPKAEERYVPTPAYDKSKAKPNVAMQGTNESSAMGIASWIICSYCFLMIGMLVLGLLGLGSGDAGMEASALSMIAAAKFLSGFNLAESLPLFIKLFLPLLTCVLIELFAILQFTKNPKRVFNITTFTVMSVMVITSLILIFGAMDSITEGLIS